MTSETLAPKRDWFPLVFGGVALAAGALVALLVTSVSNPLILLVAVIGLALVFGTVVRTELGLLALVFMTYTRFSDIAIKYHGAPSTAQPFIVFLVVVIGIRWFLYGQRPRSWGRATLLVMAYGMVGVASLLYARDYPLAQEAVIGRLKDAVIAILVTILLQRGSTLRLVIWALLAAGIFMGTISVFQYVTGTFNNAYGGFGQATIESIVDGTNDFRTSGPIGDANFYAQIMVVLVPLALERVWNEQKLWLRLLAAWALIVCTLSILFTFSRGGFIALVVALILMFIHRPPRLPALLLTATISLALLQFVPAQYTTRILTIFDLFPGGADARSEASFRGRLSENAAAWQMFVDHPLLGVGLENYRVYYQEYSRQLGLDPRRDNRPPHSLYLQIAADSGLLGLIVFGAMVGYTFRGLRKAQLKLARAGLHDYAGMVAALSAGLVGYLTAALFLHAAFPRYFWLLIGIALALPRIANYELKQAAAPAAETPPTARASATATVQA